MGNESKDDSFEELDLGLDELVEDESDETPDEGPVIPFVNAVFVDAVKH